jgi:hypothetical protein
MQGAPKARKPRAKKAKEPKKKPPLPPLDPVQQALEAGRHAIEGNRKLTLAIDALREAVQEIVYAEMDYTVKPPRPMTSVDLRRLAAEALDVYSSMTGQDWRKPRNQVVKTRAGRADGDLKKGDRSVNANELVSTDGRDYD